MAQPAHVILSGSIANEYHDTVRTFVALAAALVNTDLSACEVHVKQGSRPAHGLRPVAPAGTQAPYSRASMSGCAYYQRDEMRRPGALLTNSGMLRVQSGMRYLVTLRLTRDFAHGLYPHVWQYTRYKSAPACTFLDWTEELLHLTVHEFTHVDQYVHNWQHSELHCESVAHAALYKARRLLGTNTASRQGVAASR